MLYQDFMKHFILFEETGKRIQVQKSGSTMNRTGLSYSPFRNEFIVRELAVLKSQTSAGALK